jgi:hypothetical protein
MEQMGEGVCAESAISGDAAGNDGEGCGRIQRNPRGAGVGPNSAIGPETAVTHYLYPNAISVNAKPSKKTRTGCQLKLRLLAGLGETVKLADWSGLRIVVCIACAGASLAGCQHDTLVQTDSLTKIADVDRSNVACDLDIRIGPNGRAVWKGEVLKDFDPRPMECVSRVLAAPKPSHDVDPLGGPDAVWIAAKDQLYDVNLPLWQAESRLDAGHDPESLAFACEKAKEAEQLLRRFLITLAEAQKTEPATAEGRALKVYFEGNKSPAAMFALEAAGVRKTAC